MSAVQIIGDAAKAVSGETKYRWDDVAWRELAAMRDVLVHRYFGVDLTIVWEVVTERLPNVESHYFGVRLEIVWDVVNDELPAVVHELEDLLATDFKQEIPCCTTSRST